MNIKEIQDQLAELVAAMSDRGIVRPETDLWIKGEGRLNVHLRCAYQTGPFDGKDYKVIYADTAEGVLAAARDYIAALPSPDEIVTKEYLKRVASAVDYATEHAIDEEYVAPLRGVTCAMTDNLLTDEGGE